MVGARKDGVWEEGSKRRVGGREGRGGRWKGGRDGAREEAMMLCRERASVEEETVREG